MNGRLNWKDILVILGVVLALIGSQWKLHSTIEAVESRLSTRMDRMEARMNAMQQELSAQGKALARIEGRLDPYTLPGTVNGG